MKKLISIFVLCFFIQNLSCQERVVYGEVNYMGYPVMNVIVSAKKSEASVTTDSLGKFAIAVRENDVLTFDTKNFMKIKKRVRAKESIGVALDLKKGTLNEHGVILNNYMKANDFQLALYEAQNRSFDYGKYKDIYEVIKAKFPTVMVTSGDYTNSQKKYIYPRGRSSIMIDSYAILVVNGIIVDDISHIQPNDIKSIRILSSTEGVVRYGGIAKNGVVVIKTRVNK